MKLGGRSLANKGPSLMLRGKGGCRRGQGKKREDRALDVHCQKQECCGEFPSWFVGKFASCFDVEGEILRRNEVVASAIFLKF